MEKEKAMLSKMFKVVSVVRAVYWYLVRPITIGVKILLIADRKILLVKTRYTNYWSLPGGGVKGGESVFDCCKRELFEETGIGNSLHFDVFNVYFNFSEHKSDHIVLMVSVIEGTLLKPQKGLEIERVEFFDVKSLPDRVSPATKKRLEEYLSNNKTNLKW